MRRAGVAQLVEHLPSKQDVASSNLVARSRIRCAKIRCTELAREFRAYKEIQVKRPCGSVVEHSLGKGEVAGPIPAMGTSNMRICLDVCSVGLSPDTFLMWF